MEHDANCSVMICPVKAATVTVYIYYSGYVPGFCQQAVRTDLELANACICSDEQINHSN